MLGVLLFEFLITIYLANLRFVSFQNWIGNHRRTLSGVKAPRAPKNKLAYTKGMSAYNAFVQDQCGGNRKCLECILVQLLLFINSELSLLSFCEEAPLHSCYCRAWQ